MERDIVQWTGETVQPTKCVIYVPGLPGDTLHDFKNCAVRRYGISSGVDVWGVMHSGIKKELGGTVNDKVGVTVEDWVDDVKPAILQALKEGCSITVVGHSFGGFFAFHAIAELVKEGKLTRFQKEGFEPIHLITVSTPFYPIDSLPDRRPLLGMDPNQPFTYYRDSKSEEKVSLGDIRVPMASRYAYERIWEYLKENEFIDVNPDRELFTKELLNLFQLEKSASVLAETDIIFTALFLYQDRWVSSRSGDFLEELMGKRVLVETADIPSAFNRSMVEVNAHDMVSQWWLLVAKYI